MCVLQTAINVLPPSPPPLTTSESRFRPHTGAPPLSQRLEETDSPRSLSLVRTAELPSPPCIESLRRETPRRAPVLLRDDATAAAASAGVSLVNLVVESHGMPCRAPLCLASQTRMLAAL
jgi:hypothetical protein